MKQVAITKPKRKVNRSKRAKIGSHGFKVYKNTYVYIAKPTPESSWGGARGGKPAPRKEIVDRVIKTFNTDKQIRKIVKHVKGISVKYSTNPRFGGRWNTDKQFFEFVDYSYMRIEDVDEVVYHELIGHAYWDWAKKWRNESWAKFNEIANRMPPVNDYVAKYIEDKRDGRTDTIYENEQHSAIAEIIMAGKSYHTRTGKRGKVASEEQIEEMKKVWMEMHY